jgi:tight adherence protein C
MLAFPDLTPFFIAMVAAVAVIIAVGFLIRVVQRLMDGWRLGEAAALVRRPALPAWLRVGLPLARALASRAGPHLPVRLRAYCQAALRRAGLDEELLPQEWLMLAAVWSMAVSVAILMWLQPPWPVALCIGLILLLLPWLWLRDTRKRREQDILRDLPIYLDMLTLALEAGGALSVALRVATERAVDSPLKQAFLRVQGDLRAGRSRAEALRALGERLDIASMAPLIAALIQADASGGSLAAVLRAQSEQRLNERYAAAEKLAMEAPVKMLLPLILCIFPCTVLVLAFPIVMRFLSAFG